MKGQVYQLVSRLEPGPHPSIASLPNVDDSMMSQRMCPTDHVGNS
jgi:hypothetical protein